MKTLTMIQLSLLFMIPFHAFAQGDKIGGGEHLIECTSFFKEKYSVREFFAYPNTKIKLEVTGPGDPVLLKLRLMADRLAEKDTHRAETYFEMAKQIHEDILALESGKEITFDADRPYRAGRSQLPLDLTLDADDPEELPKNCKILQLFVQKIPEFSNKPTFLYYPKTLKKIRRKVDHYVSALWHEAVYFDFRAHAPAKRFPKTSNTVREFTRQLAFDTFKDLSMVKYVEMMSKKSKVPVIRNGFIYQYDRDRVLITDLKLDGKLSGLTAGKEEIEYDLFTGEVSGFTISGEPQGICYNPKEEDETLSFSWFGDDILDSTNKCNQFGYLFTLPGKSVHFNVTNNVATSDLDSKMYKVMKVKNGRMTSKNISFKLSINLSTSRIIDFEELRKIEEAPLMSSDS